LLPWRATHYEIGVNENSSNPTIIGVLRELDREPLRLAAQKEQDIDLFKTNSELSVQWSFAVPFRER